MSSNIRLRLRWGGAVVIAATLLLAAGVVGAGADAIDPVTLRDLGHRGPEHRTRSFGQSDSSGDLAMVDLDRNGSLETILCWNEWTDEGPAARIRVLSPVLVGEQVVWTLLLDLELPSYCAGILPEPVSRPDGGPVILVTHQAGQSTYTSYIHHDGAAVHLSDSVYAALDEVVDVTGDGVAEMLFGVGSTFGERVDTGVDHVRAWRDGDWKQLSGGAAFELVHVPRSDRRPSLLLALRRDGRGSDAQWSIEVRRYDSSTDSFEVSNRAAIQPLSYSDYHRAKDDEHLKGEFLWLQGSLYTGALRVRTAHDQFQLRDDGTLEAATAPQE